jgi:hypothetical protein
MARPVLMVLSSDLIQSYPLRLDRISVMVTKIGIAATVASTVLVATLRSAMPKQNYLHFWGMRTEEEGYGLLKWISGAQSSGKSISSPVPPQFLSGTSSPNAQYKLHYMCMADNKII